MLMHPALVNAMCKLERDPDVGATVLARMATVEERCPGDAGELLEALYSMGIDWAVDYADSQGPVRPPGSSYKDKFHRPGSNKNNQNGNGPQQETYVAAPGAFDTPCFCYREQDVCNLQGCPHVHEGRTGTLCTDSEFKSTGICSNFKKCLHVHRWDEKKHGPIKDAKAKIPGASAQQMALKFAQTMMVGECANVTVSEIGQESDSDGVATGSESESEGEEVDENVEMMEGPRSTRGQLTERAKYLHAYQVSEAHDSDYEGATGEKSECSEESEARDSTFESMSQPESEDIDVEDDADMQQITYDPFDMTDMEQALRVCGGMSQGDIKEWSSHSTDLLKALITADELKWRKWRQECTV